MEQQDNTEEYSSLSAKKEPALVEYVDNIRTPKSVRINIFGNHTKVCSFNCPYCEFGETTIRLNQVKNIENLPDLDDLITQASQLVSKMDQEGRPVERVVVTGPGEATLHPKFAEFTAKLMEWRDQVLPDCKLATFVNGTYLDQRKIFNVVAKYDECYCKLDAGNEKTLKAMNSPLVRISTERILEGYRRLDNVIIMSMFMDGAARNTGDEHISDWLEVLGIVQPKNVILSTISRRPWSPGLEGLSEDGLQIIAAKLRMKLGLIAKTSLD